MLFDEHISVLVARALAVLGLNVSHVGAEGEPPQGTDDERILATARMRNQTVVTANHDMIVLCIDEGESVVWVDPRDKDLTRTAMVSMCFGQVEDWQRHLQDADKATVVVARKTRCDVLAPEVAKRRALERGKRHRRKQRKAGRHNEANGGLLE